MRRGRPLKPIISIESITAALKMLDFSAQGQSRTSALENLQLIDFHLQSANPPLAENIRSWMLCKILVDYITIATNQTREYFDLKPLSITQNRQNEVKSLEQVIQSASSELIGWSVLYLRYVRPELSFSVSELADLLHINERTLRRYQDIAIHKLQDILINAEWNVRQNQQTAYLKSQIPYRIAKLIGRERELNRIYEHLNRDVTHPIFISGPVGIGKSALCANIANTLIEQETLDYLLWIRRPENIEHIRNKTWDVISPYKTQSHWREVLEYQQLLLIIEDVDDLLEDTGWNDFLTELQKAFVLITDKTVPSQFPSDLHIALKPLSENSSTELLPEYQDNNLTESQIKAILENASGNPLKILHFSRHSQTSRDNSQQFFSDYFDTEFDELSHAERKIALLGTLSRNGLDVDFIDNFMGKEVENNSLFTLRTQANSLYLSDSFVAYVQERFSHDDDLKKVVHELITALLDIIDENDTASKILLDCLTNDWCDWQRADIQSVLETINLSQLSSTDVRRWYNIYLRYFGLDRDNTDSLVLSAQYGLALRILRHPDCEQYLIDLIQFLGNKSEFELQVHLYYELALLHQASSAFEQALEIYHHIRQSLRNYASPRLLKLVNLQFARIAISRHNIDDALQELEGSDLNRPDLFVLFCEAQLLKEEYTFLIDTIRQYLGSHVLKASIVATLHTILARAYQGTNLDDEAIVHFNEALSITEQDMTQGDIARARSNLASAYLKSMKSQSSGVLDDLENVLINNQILQRQVRDFVGLEATTRNLAYLQSYRLKTR